MFNRRKKLIQVWNKWKVSKWWQNLNCWVNYAFKAHLNIADSQNLFMLCGHPATPQFCCQTFILKQWNWERRIKLCEEWQACFPQGCCAKSSAFFFHMILLWRTARWVIQGVLQWLSMAGGRDTIRSQLFPKACGPQLIHCWVLQRKCTARSKTCMQGQDIWTGMQKLDISIEVLFFFFFGGGVTEWLGWPHPNLWIQ